MRVIDSEEFQSPLTEFPHQTLDFRRRDAIIPDRIGRNVLRRERLRNESILPGQNSAAFPMRLAARMLQELPVYFSTTSDGSLHLGSI